MNEPDMELAEVEAVLDGLSTIRTMHHCILCAPFGQPAPNLIGIHGRSPWCPSCGHVYASMVMRGGFVTINFGRIQ